MKPIQFTLLSLAVMGLFTGSARADWPTVGGSSARHGQTGVTGPSAPMLLWQGTVSAWFGGQCYIENDKLVLMRFTGLTGTPAVCHDLNTGAQLWTFSSLATNARMLPIGFRDGQVYVVRFQETQHDSVYALNPADGSVIWRAQTAVAQGITASAVFASDGDLILAGDNARLVRVDRVTGQTVWSTNRPLPNTGAEKMAAFGNTVYGWKGYINTPKELTAWNMDTGAQLYSLALPGDGDQEIPLSVGPDGTIYCRRDGGLFYAIEDHGAGLSLRWSRTLDAPGTYPNYAVGTDGSVYVPDGLQLVRLDPATGNELNRSMQLINPGPAVSLNSRLAVGADGTLYVGNCASSDGCLYAMAPDLTILWQESISGMVYGAPALGSNGALAVSGGGTTLKVFRTAAATPEVTVSLAPVGGPIQIPPGGGSFQFNATLANGETSPQSFETWAQVNLPSGGSLLNLGPLALTLPGSANITRLRTVTVPAAAPAGLYWYWAAVGDYPGAIWDSSGFSFTKLATGNGPFVGDWACTGEPFPGEVGGPGSVMATPEEIALNASPNPFNPTTALSYELSAAGHVNLKVYDTAGREVAILVNSRQDAGYHNATFDASHLPSGTYFARLTAGNFTQVQKLILLK
ncbi:MAG: T9SS C-terminal target domain-containing protein [Candidatus Zixiibacteriota bacterium]|nr:MAG: T9SS C-terminal target domain-containing protein [candidate division Zixibacteria bacterium]